MKRKFRRRLIYTLAKLAAAIIYLLPIKAGVFLAGWLGVLAFYLLGRHRRQTLDNLKGAFGGQKSPNEIYDTAKGVFRNFGKSAAEFINFPKLNASNIDRFVRVRGIEKVDKALQDKRGVIGLVCHLGNWELLAAYFGLKGYPSNVIARPSRYERYDRIINSTRRAKNINIIPREHSFKKAVSVLRNNQLVGILPDQDIDSIDGVFVDFFGKPAYTPTGPVLLAMASAAPVFTMFCVRENAGHTLFIDGPMELEITGNRQRDILVNTQKWSNIVEGYIRRYPSQWVWFHKRWKTQAKKHNGTAKEAFTLVELLIVIVIIGILATLAVPQYQKMVERSKSAEAFNGLGAFKRAQLIYYAGYGIYAGQMQYLDVTFAGQNNRTTKNFYFSAAVGVGHPRGGGRPLTMSAITNAGTLDAPAWGSPQYHCHDTGDIIKSEMESDSATPQHDHNDGKGPHAHPLPLI